MTRREIKHGKLIGRQGEEYYYLDYIFHSTLHNKPFNGAVGTVMRPVSEEEAEDRRERFDEDGELWRDAVAAKETELSHEDWVEMVLRFDGDDVVFDCSYYEYGEDLLGRIDPGRETYDLVECVGGGRCFRPDMVWDELFDPDLWAKIVKVETLAES